MSLMKIRFVKELPPDLTPKKRTVRSKWREAADLMSKRMGVWAIVDTKDTKSAAKALQNNLRSSHNKAFTDYVVEAEVRPHNGKFDVYARITGYRTRKEDSGEWCSDRVS